MPTAAEMKRLLVTLACCVAAFLSLAFYYGGYFGFRFRTLAELCFVVVPIFLLPVALLGFRQARASAVFAVALFVVFFGVQLWHFGPPWGRVVHNGTQFYKFLTMVLLLCGAALVERIWPGDTAPHYEYFAGFSLAAATLAVYYPVRYLPFCIADDSAYVVDNPHLKHVDWSTIKWAFTSYYAANWHPLTWLSHAFDCQLFSLDPGRHHQANAVLAALNVVLLFWILWRATGFAGRSFMVAALFAVHPLNVESVAWIAERKNLLSMSFFLLALSAYGWYVAKPRVERYMVVAFLFLCGLMSKPQVITFPAVLLLWDYWPLRRTSGPRGLGSLTEAPSETTTGKSFTYLIVEKLPLFMLSAASAIVTVKAQLASGAMGEPLNTFPFPSRLANVFVSYPRYLEKAFWPSRLAFLYPHPVSSLPIWQPLTAGCLLLAVTAIVIAYRQYRYLPVGWFWFLGTLVPMIGLVQVGPQAMADRYAYLPLVGLFIMVCWGVADWAKRGRFATGWLMSGSVAALVALAMATHRQIGYWESDISLWSHTVQVTGRNYLAEDGLGVALLAHARVSEAMTHFRSAQGIAPQYPPTYYYLGQSAQQRGYLRDAIDQYATVIQLTQDAPEKNASLRASTYNAMGLAYLSLSDYADATKSFEASQSQHKR